MECTVDMIQYCSLPTQARKTMKSSSSHYYQFPPKRNIFDTFATQSQNQQIFRFIMPATRSATRSAASASAVTNELQAVIKEAAEVAVTNLNAMSGYTGGFAAQLGDYFCDTYQGAVGSGSTPDSHTKSRAFIMYTNDENTKLTCVLDLAQWKKNSEEVGITRS